MLYDVTSSSYEGRTCPLVQFGHNRDEDKLPIIVYGVMTDEAGRPVAVQVYAGNTGDPSTVGDQVEKLRQRFGLGRVVLVGDRGMLTPPQIKQTSPASWHGLDHGADQRCDSRIGAERGLATLLAGRTEPG
ncbi:MAG: hypothetical protein ABSH52_16190 [Terriglobia bacterium]